MVAFNDDTLVITIRDNEPQQRLLWLIQAIAAAVRWKASNEPGEVYALDGQHLYTLAELLEALADYE